MLWAFLYMPISWILTQASKIALAIVVGVCKALQIFDPESNKFYITLSFARQF